ncbi:MAG: YggS family pyridoxal phosphate-dependent enzyme, partial [Planctomycetota bacterium]
TGWHTPPWLASSQCMHVDTLQHTKNQMDDADRIRENWLRVQQEVGEAEQRFDRSRPVQSVGVSKYVGPELTSLLTQAGCGRLGENRPQVLWEKWAWFESAGLPQPTWDVIGHLQRNKVRRTLPMTACLHSLDSPRLAHTLQNEAKRIDLVLPVLLEVNVTEDESKTGLRPPALRELLDELRNLDQLEPRGIMAMSTHFSGGDQARREFEQVRLLRDALQPEYPDFDLRELSMGMSGDFVEAIAEGATIVRIGSNLWEGVERR